MYLLLLVLATLYFLYVQNGLILNGHRQNYTIQRFIQGVGKGDIPTQAICFSSQGVGKPFKIINCSISQATALSYISISRPHSQLYNIACAYMYVGKTGEPGDEASSASLTNTIDALQLYFTQSLQFWQSYQVLSWVCILTPCTCAIMR